MSPEEAQTEALREFLVPILTAVHDALGADAMDIIDVPVAFTTELGEGMGQRHHIVIHGFRCGHPEHPWHVYVQLRDKYYEAITPTEWEEQT